jgi:2-oxo-4-hydroxy-4-carboxy-5-ureidoimidazoline decarboxylase
VTVRIEEFNAADPEEAAAALRPCADVGWWVDGLVARRPYPDAAELYGQATGLAARFGPDDVEAALTQHPRLGERRQGEDAEARFSASEQSGLADADAEALAAGNKAYEERFGRIFLIRAAGRDQAEILAELHRRLELDPQEEVKVVATELAAIALRRLREAVTDE